MDWPTYYDGFVSGAEEDEDWVTFYLSVISDEDYFEVYTDGTLENGKFTGSLVVAKSMDTGREIVAFDRMAHGYDSMFCSVYTPEARAARTLTKMNVEPVRLEITLEYGMNYEGEKGAFEFNEKGEVRLADGSAMSWEDVKRNGITGISVDLFNAKGKRMDFVDEELA